MLLLALKISADEIARKDAFLAPFRKKRRKFRGFIRFQYETNSDLIRIQHHQQHTTIHKLVNIVSLMKMRVTHVL